MGISNTFDQQLYETGPNSIFAFLTDPDSGARYNNSHPFPFGDFIRTLIMQGKGFSVSTGIITAPAAGNFPLSFFKAAANGNTILIYSIEIVNANNIVNLVTSQSTDASLSFGTPGSNVPLTPVNNLLQNANTSVVNAVTNNVSQTISGTNLIVTAGINDQALANGKIIALPPSVANCVVVYAEVGGANKYGITLSYVEF